MNIYQKKKNRIKSLSLLFTKFTSRLWCSTNGNIWKAHLLSKLHPSLKQRKTPFFQCGRFVEMPIVAIFWMCAATARRYAFDCWNICWYFRWKMAFYLFAQMQICLMNNSAFKLSERLKKFFRLLFKHFSQCWLRIWITGHNFDFMANVMNHFNMKIWTFTCIWIMCFFVLGWKFNCFALHLTTIYVWFFEHCFKV